MQVLHSPSSESTSRTYRSRSLGPWRCGNCDKEFAQKEYRHKHQQRCVLASSRPRLSKQKSCVACAASKLGCDREMPCSRCKARNRACRYVPSRNDRQQDTRSERTTSGVGDQRSPTGGVGSMRGEESLISPPWPPSFQPGLEQEGHAGFGGPEWSAPAMDTMAQAEDSRALLGAAWRRGDSGLLPAAMEDAMAQNQYDDILTEQPDAGFDFNLLSSMGSMNQDDAMPHAHAFAASISRMVESSATGGSTEISIQSSPENNPPQPAEQETLHDAMARVYGDDLPSRMRGAENPDPPSTCPFAKLTSDDALVTLVRGYPRLMVRPGTYPPFVHHKLYPCETGEVAESLAKAFCCVGAFYASLPTTKAFVYEMMSEESGRLVRGFNRGPSSDVNMLAVVHAMCIYQIVGFFAGGSAEHVRGTGMQHSFFLKMTRLLIQQHIRGPAPSEETGEVGWRQWIMSETIRRTVLLINAINVLSCRVQRQDRVFYEPLDADVIMKMALPATDLLWQASSAEDWEAAKARLGVSYRSLTLQEAVNQLAVGDGTLYLGGDNGGKTTRYEELNEFTRLVIFTASIEKDL